MLIRKNTLLGDKGFTTRISEKKDGVFLLSLFFAKIKTSEEGDDFWRKDSLIFTSSIIKTIKKQRF